VKLEIFDLNGRKVRSLSDEYLQPGIHSIKWDLFSDRKIRVVNGLYFYRLITDKFSVTGRIIVK
jgi:flagellar hook assembly protein FlgD